jgi:hypothetical protein
MRSRGADQDEAPRNPARCRQQQRPYAGEATTQWCERAIAPHDDQSAA